MRRCVASLRRVTHVQARCYWKVGADDPFFQALLELDAHMIIDVYETKPDDPKHMEDTVISLFALAKVDAKQRQYLRTDATVTATVERILRHSIESRNEELCSATCEYLHMAEGFDEEDPLTAEAMRAFPNNTVIAKQA
eukprot:TRINITY_DN37493_c0_g1_i1.p2 TRINITY_DN37493_c0_g1~~TRINITY_DN37493_c0_g1_i1.p2  ORF type:complete len:149 (+),score=41.32 TRINITY_DN37493_c0_g1_i1:33-449(+)